MTLIACSGKNDVLQCVPAVQTHTVYEKQQLPAALLTLPPLPVPPERNETKMQSDVQPYYIELGEQYKSCRSKIQTIRNLVEEK